MHKSITYLIRGKFALGNDWCPDWMLWGFVDADSDAGVRIAIAIGVLSGKTGV